MQTRVVGPQEQIWGGFQGYETGGAGGKSLGRIGGNYRPRGSGSMAGLSRRAVAGFTPSSGSDFLGR